MDRARRRDSTDSSASGASSTSTDSCASRVSVRATSGSPGLPRPRAAVMENPQEGTVSTDAVEVIRTKSPSGSSVITRTVEVHRSVSVTVESPVDPMSSPDSAQPHVEYPATEDEREGQKEERKKKKKKKDKEENCEDEKDASKKKGALGMLEKVLHWNRCKDKKDESEAEENPKAEDKPEKKNKEKKGEDPKGVREIEILAGDKMNMSQSADDGKWAKCSDKQRDDHLPDRTIPQWTKVENKTEEPDLSFNSRNTKQQQIHEKERVPSWKNGPAGAGSESTSNSKTPRPTTLDLYPQQRPSVVSSKVIGGTGSDFRLSSVTLAGSEGGGDFREIGKGPAARPYAVGAPLGLMDYKAENRPDSTGPGSRSPAERAVLRDPPLGSAARAASRAASSPEAQLVNAATSPAGKNTTFEPVGGTPATSRPSESRSFHSRGTSPIAGNPSSESIGRFTVTSPISHGSSQTFRGKLEDSSGRDNRGRSIAPASLFSSRNADSFRKDEGKYEPATVAVKTPSREDVRPPAALGKPGTGPMGGREEIATPPVLSKDDTKTPAQRSNGLISIPHQQTISRESTFKPIVPLHSKEEPQRPTTAKTDLPVPVRHATGTCSACAASADGYGRTCNVCGSGSGSSKPDLQPEESSRIKLKTPIPTPTTTSSSNTRSKEQAALRVSSPENGQARKSSPPKPVRVETSPKNAPRNNPPQPDKKTQGVSNPAERRKTTPPVKEPPRGTPSAAPAGRSKERCQCCSRSLAKPTTGPAPRSPIISSVQRRAHSASPARRKTATAARASSPITPDSGSLNRNSAPTATGLTLRTPAQSRRSPAMGNGAGRVQRNVSCYPGTTPGTTWSSAGAHSVDSQQVQVPLPLPPPACGWDYIALESEVQDLRRELRARRGEELRLRREIHKLRSVLQQATSFGDIESPGEHDGGGRAGVAPGAVAGEGEGEERDGLLLTSLQARHSMAGGRAAGRAGAGAGDSKKQGVSGESSDPDNSSAELCTFQKDFRSQQLIKAAILDNDFLKNLARSQIREVVDCMYPQTVAQGSYVVREGEAGSHLYVLAEGEMEVLKEDTVLGRMGPGKAFGELAILYNCTRTASIRAVTELQVWVLDRKVFQQIMMRTGLQRLQENLSFLRSVPLLKNLSETTLTKMADVLEVEFYPAGTYIIRQGASGHTFFIISGGSVQVTQRMPASGEEVVIRTLERGDYFGEQALLHDDCRTASVLALAPGVECLTLDRESFLALIGSLSELQEKDYGDESRQLSRPPSAYSFHSDSAHDCEVELLRLEDLQVVGTLGVGGFGSVRLVAAGPGAGTGPGTHSYALKCLNKSHIVATGQQAHVLAERDVLLSVHCPFIVRLHRTFRDERSVYLLMEACLGGELWTLLRDRGSLEDAEARFATGCVLEALEYLHARNIVYRDLKPENLVLDARGYVKLVDFGFAKRLQGRSKTWTFCGTPEYVAPEVILNRGHDRAVDCWALGVLVFELLTGAPPFAAADPMRTYNLILKGMECVVIPRAVSRAAAHLIRRLCRAAPAERLGCQRAGFQDVRQHKWFQGFDWDGLKQQTLVPPIVTKVSGPLDISNFDADSHDEDTAPIELSNWEADF